MNKYKIMPSLLSANFADIRQQIAMCEEAGIDVLHADIMDGHFVPNITFGPMFVEMINGITELPIDCHLMIENPDKYIPNFAKAGADYISVHAEAVPHLHRTLQLIRDCGAKPGVALNPITPLEYALEAVPYSDFILLMSVNPGFGGQSFIEAYLDRAKRLKDYIDKNGYNCEIQVDGGVKLDNVKQIAEAGANMIVSGSGLFSGNFAENTAKMRSILDSIE